MDEDAIVKKFGVSFVEAETLGPALLAYSMLAKRFQLERLFVCDTNLRDGLLYDMSVGGHWTADFRNQIIRSALSLGRKFGFDETHARNVAELSNKLFRQLDSEHQLENRHEVILFVAALLHEIGLIVNTRSNHKHALYLICHSELFGLSEDEMLLVGLVARYHRRASPHHRTRATERFPSNNVWSLPNWPRCYVLRSPWTILAAVESATFRARLTGNSWSSRFQAPTTFHWNKLPCEMAPGCFAISLDSRFCYGQANDERVRFRHSTSSDC